ncbi:MAG: glycerol-3-phosphate 1-O-acyltransferase PlsY [Candidatus Omnitrophica bacterium]|nr:glycerol-3-phosphate 1-O-acyltransferase PlsY [Candidatus Omnitrophota bacterium]
MLWIISAAVISYLVGSIPTAYIFGRLLKGIDIRQCGSGNVGATNALRVMGKGAGITILILDMLKGFIVTVFLADQALIQSRILSEEALRVLLGVGAICGHNWTLFLRFKGGKGIATTLGVLLGLALRLPGLWAVFLTMVLTWGIFFTVIKIVSVASVIMGIALPFYMFLFTRSKFLVLFGTLLSLLIILRHRLNLIRFLQGKEPRLDFKKSK